MALRINCPACKTVNVVDDEKRGKKIRCKKCEKPIVVPAEKSKRDDTQAIQDAHKTKLKMAASSHNRNDEDDAEDDEERPTKKQKTNTTKKKGGFPVMLVVGGIGALLFLLLLGGGTAGYFLFIRKSDTPPNDADLIAKVEDKKNDRTGETKKDGEKKEDPKTDSNNKKDFDPLPMKKEDDKIEPKKEPEPEPKKKPDPVTPPVPDPKKEPEPEPKKKVDPLPKVFPPPNPIIDELPADILQRVKRAIVSIQATMPTGKRIDGSGFLVDEKGIIVTNAEVVGTGISASAPIVIQVGLTGGDGKLRTVPAQLVGVDPVNRLAILRVNGADLSKPLELSKNPAPGLSQTVFVGGPKPAAKPGPEIIVRPAIAFGFRKFADGMFDLVNLRTGMGPASAGGPIVDIEGNVVAIAISGNATAPESSATPGYALRLILDGRLNDPSFGIPYVSAQLGRPVIPVRVSTLDPLERVKELKVEAWSGPAGPPRPPSTEMPIAAVGDGPITPHTVKMSSGQGSLDVPFPAIGIGPGQMIWVRAVGTSVTGVTTWGPAAALTADVIPVDRRAAALALNLKGEAIRTVSLRTTARVVTMLPSMPGSGQYFESEYKADLLEIIAPEFGGATLRGAFGNVTARAELDGKGNPTANAGIDLFRMIPPNFSIFPNNKLKPQLNRDVAATIPLPARSGVERHYSAIFSSLEAAMIPLPTRVVQPLETFAAQVPYMLRAGKNPQFADIELVCKLEGTRTRNARVEAVVSMTGKMKGRDLSTRDSIGEVTGQFAFDLTGGYLSQVHLNLASDMEANTGMVGSVLNISIDVSRIPGNPLNIELQTDPKKVPDPKKIPDPKIPNPKDSMPKGAKTIFTTQGALLPTGAINPKSKQPPTGPPKSVTIQGIKLEMGKSYTVMVFANTFNAQIKLEDAAGLPVVTQNDKVPGNNARITVRPMQTGLYRVVVSSTKGSGQFQVVVQELP